MARRVFCFLYVLLWPLLTHSAALRTGFLPNLSQRVTSLAAMLNSWLLSDSYLISCQLIAGWHAWARFPGGPAGSYHKNRHRMIRQISPDKNIHPVGWKISNEVELSQHNRAIYSRHNAWAGSSDEPWALLSMANLPTDSAFGACTRECG